MRRGREGCEGGGAACSGRVGAPTCAVMAAASDETRSAAAPNLRASASLDAVVEMAHVSQPMALRRWGGREVVLGRTGGRWQRRRHSRGVLQAHVAEASDADNPDLVARLGVAPAQRGAALAAQ